MRSRAADLQPVNLWRMHRVFSSASGGQGSESRTLGVVGHVTTTERTDKMKSGGESMTNLRKTFSHTWTLSSYTCQSTYEGFMLSSPQFCSPSDSRLNWVIDLYPKGKTATTDPGIFSIYSCNYSSIYLKFNPNDKISAVARFSFSFCHAGKSSYTTAVAEHKFEKNERFGFELFVDSVHLQTSQTGNRPTDSAITIVCDITLMFNRTMEIEIPPSRLPDDFGQLLTTGKFSDVTLTADGTDFLAHKTILAARSPVFSAMFTHNLDETKNSRVVIEDISHATLMEMLQFIYTDKVMNLDGLAENLLMAADKYDLERLKSICGNYMCQNITTESVAHTLVMADVYNAKDLKLHATKFIRRHSKEVVSTAAWKTMMTTHSHIAMEVLMDLVMTLP